MTVFPILFTSRLQLRELLLSDSSSLFSIHNDAKAMRWFGNDAMIDQREADQLINLFADWRRRGTGIRWAIERSQDGVFLGTCGLFKWNRNWQSCAIGYELAPFAQGSGYMIEALNAAIKHGFESMQLNRIEALVHPQNVNSIRTLEALGFRQEGYQRQAGYWHGAYHDLIQFALLRIDFTHRC